MFEDDASLNAAVALKAIELATVHIEEHGYIQLPVRRVDENAPAITEADGVRLLAPEIVPLRLSGQMISQSAARQLLRMTKVFDRPVDTFLQMFWITGIRPVVVDPSGLADCTHEAGGSTISEDKTLTNRLSREAKRFWYRRCIARLSKREIRNRR